MSSTEMFNEKHVKLNKNSQSVCKHIENEQIKIQMFNKINIKLNKKSLQGNLF
jgi:hypothetical protein